MTTWETVVHLVYLACAALFVLGLHLMGSPRTARRGNLISAGGMVVGLATAVLSLLGTAPRAWAVLALLAGTGLGSAAGAVKSRTVKMTDMPQLVSLFNAAGGGAAALVATIELVGRGTSSGGSGSHLAAAAEISIGAVTFTGSLVAASKLQGLLPGRPLRFSGGTQVNLALITVLVVGSIVAGTWWPSAALFGLIGLAALAFGVLLVLPIGGADMPVVVSLLNAMTGVAVAMAGFLIGNSLLITAGALVGASGAILTQLMAAAMNRSVVSILMGGFGTGDDAVVTSTSDAPVHSVGADDVAIQLAYARKVVIIPGYGLAAAQAQREIVDLADDLIARGVDVTFGIHPVAGRMPGHMNVLLAETHLPYELMRDLDESNQDLAHADVALIVGANDVVNPLARTKGSSIYGMPILDADRATSVVVIKRSMGHGYAGIDNPLFSEPRTSMFFSDAKEGLTSIRSAVGALVA